MSSQDTIQIKMCSTCGECFPRSFFRPYPGDSGSRSQCRKCDNIGSRARAASRYAERRLWWADVKRSLGCQVCGERESVCLEFHHIDRSTKRWVLAYRVNCGIPALLQEMAKCAVVCANCHAKIEHGIIRPVLVAVDPASVPLPDGQQWLILP